MADTMQRIEDQAYDKAAQMGSEMKTQARIDQAESDLQRNFWQAIDYFNPRAFSAWVRRYPALSFLSAVGISTLVGLFVKRRR